MHRRPPAALALTVCFAAGLLSAACVEPNNDSAEGMVPGPPDAAVRDTTTPDAAADAPKPKADTAAPAPDASPPDAPPPSPDRPPAADAPPPPPDAPPSPCPGGPAPADYGLRCGCGDSMGTVQCSGKCSVDDAACVPTGPNHLLSNTFLGPGKVLDTYGGDGANNAFMNDPCCTGRLWTITPNGDGTYRLSNMFLGDGRRLETTDGTTLFMGGSTTTPAQSWRITGAGKSTFRIRNAALGAARSLDTKNDATNAPFMGTTGDVSGQYWLITKMN